jgi:hypothetical protein
MFADGSTLKYNGDDIKTTLNGTGGVDQLKAGSMAIR